MRSILEKAFVALLNEEQDKAEELFHKFMVERARQIHESLREGVDVELDECEKEVTEETHFNEQDLSELEEDNYSEEYTNEDEMSEDYMSEDDMSDEDDDDMDMDLPQDDMSDDDMSDDDMSDDDMDDMPHDDMPEDDMDDDGMGADTDMLADERIDSLEDQIEKLTAKYEAILDTISGFDSDEDEDEDKDEESHEFGSDDVDSDDVDSDDDSEDFEDDDMDKMPESEMYEDFNDLTESIIDELEKVKVSLEDGKEIGTGSKINQNRGAAIPQKNKDARMGGEPIKMKSAEHKGYARETAPATKDMPKRRNTRPAATAGMDKVSKEGNKSAEINKLSSESGNTTSPLQGTKNVVK